VSLPLPSSPARDGQFGMPVGMPLAMPRDVPNAESHCAARVRRGRCGGHSPHWEPRMMVAMIRMRSRGTIDPRVN